MSTRGSDGGIPAEKSSGLGMSMRILPEPVVAADTPEYLAGAAAATSRVPMATSWLREASLTAMVWPMTPVPKENRVSCRGGEGRHFCRGL